MSRRLPSILRACRSQALASSIAAFAPTLRAEPPPVSQPPPVAQPAPPSAPAPTPAETSAEVLRLYVAQEDAAALRTVEAGLNRCDLATRRDCSDLAKSQLQRDRGIVLAGGYRDHEGAVVAFREALRLDHTISIPPDLLVQRVRAAFVEAGGKPPPAPPAPVEQGPAVASAAPVQTAASPRAEGPRYDIGDTFVLVAAEAGWSSAPNGESYGDFRGALSGHWHVAGPLVVGARLSAGSTSVGTDVTTLQNFGPYGVLGAALLLGVLPRGKRNTGYLTFGIGPDWFPELERARTIVSFAGGASFGGFTFGGMPAVTIEPNIVGGTFLFFLGWGGYVKD